MICLFINGLILLEVKSLLVKISSRNHHSNKCSTIPHPMIFIYISVVMGFGLPSPVMCAAP
ncbi:hypothetical protein QTP88_001550 [Uroleucon formosanum]